MMLKPELLVLSKSLNLIHKSERSNHRTIHRFVVCMLFRDVRPQGSKL